jgi:anti-sigma regulatory factor (Ser/Thr protein kinase)
VTSSPVAPVADPQASAEGFRHEALFYAGEAEFLDRTTRFIREGLAAGEPILVAVPEPKVQWLRSALGEDAPAVRFADMREVGRNPARIISAWRDFVAECARAGGPFRGIGEPIWAGRSPEELVECERHEALLNLAFAGSTAWWLVCPYDTQALDLSVIERARRTHPFVLHGGLSRESPLYRGLADVSGALDHPLPEPDAPPEEMRFGWGQLEAVRAFVLRRATAHGLERERAHDLVLAVNEVATNSLRHGGGRGVLRMWPERASLVAEVRDGGSIRDPLAGRIRPGPDQSSGFGLWLANQLCDLVQVRSLPSGTVVRLHASARRPAP